TINSCTILARTKVSQSRVWFLLSRLVFSSSPSGLRLIRYSVSYEREPTKYKKEQWMAEEILELHKAAYSGLGIWRETGVDMPPSSILLRPPPSHVPFQES